MNDKSRVAYCTDILIYAIDSRENSNCRGLPQKYFSILMVKRNKEPYKNQWCLPGGYVAEIETSYEAAKRVLKKETNLVNTYIKQLATFDAIKRDPRGRNISTAYLALVDKSKIKETLAKGTKWFDISITENQNEINLILENEEQIKVSILKKKINKEANQYSYILKNSKNIAFDHGLMINDGILELRKQAQHTDIIFNLMPKKFTIGELKQVYEIILGKKIINSAFRREIGPKVKQCKNEKIKTGGHRPSALYQYIGLNHK